MIYFMAATAGEQVCSNCAEKKRRLLRPPAVADKQQLCIKDGTMGKHAKLHFTTSERNQFEQAAVS